MAVYVGIKGVKAHPMKRAAYSELRGWDLPKDENGEDDGYLVEYLDGGKPNVEGFAGYVSWSPKEVFERAYKPLPDDLKVSRESIEAKIANVAYMQLGQKLTLAIVTLKNGYEIIGASACVDPANFDAKLGEEYALENAIDKLWPLEGYLLQEKLATVKGC